MATKKARKTSKKTTKGKAVKKAKPAKKMKAKATKAKSASGIRKKTKAPLRKKSVLVLPKMQKNAETQAANPEAWKHKKNLPPQDLYKERLQQKHSDVKRNRTSGFGSRHH